MIVDNVFQFVTGLLGIIFTCVGFFVNRLGNKIKAERTILTEGVVTGLDARYDEDGTTYALRVQFINDHGEIVEGNSMVSKSKSLMKDYPIGTKIHVLYDALDSSKFIVKEFDTNILGIVGKIFLGIGIVLLIICLIITFTSFSIYI